MAAGIALDDAMRLPWLRCVATELHGAARGTVASCSALRRPYRDILRRHGDVFFVHLSLDLDTARARMQARPGHFMNPALADSQQAILEVLKADEWGMTIDATAPPSAQLDQICSSLWSRP